MPPAFFEALSKEDLAAFDGGGERIRGSRVAERPSRYGQTEKRGTRR